MKSLISSDCCNDSISYTTGTTLILVVEDDVGRYLCNNDGALWGSSIFCGTWSCPIDDDVDKIGNKDNWDLVVGFCCATYKEVLVKLEPLVVLEEEGKTIS